jgi:hypothetical protein
MRQLAPGISRRKVCKLFKHIPNILIKISLTIIWRNKKFKFTTMMGYVKNLKKSQKYYLE